MTPKEKAKELVDKYYTNNDLPLQTLSFIKSKQCALIAVDEILNYSEEWDDSEYWQQVKEEIEKL